jgi:3-oxoacyl-[acyl-carrier protein] reductase
VDLGLRDRVYLITGGSRGLGFAAAEILVSEGARVVLSGTRGDVAAKAAAELGGPACAVSLAADNADPDTAQRLVAATLGAFDRMDGALISGGGPPAGQLVTATDDQWRSGFELVFLGAVRIAREVAGALGTDGSIAFVLSSSARSPIRGLGLSNGLRPGLAMAAKVLADELGPQGIRVNGLLPGRTSTEGLRELDAAYGEERAAYGRAAIPLGRDGTPEEFGRVAAFVLSPAASYVTGAMIAVDGGAQRAL